MTEPKLTAPLVDVILEGRDPLDGIQTDNRDLLAWERVRVNHKWPDAQSAPSKWLTFLAWNAARRQGRVGTDMRHEDWEALVLEVQIREDDADSEAGAPFPEGDETPPVGGAGDSDTDPPIRVAV